MLLNGFSAIWFVLASFRSVFIFKNRKSVEPISYWLMAAIFTYKFISSPRSLNSSTKRKLDNIFSLTTEAYFWLPFKFEWIDEAISVVVVKSLTFFWQRNKLLRFGLFHSLIQMFRKSFSSSAFDCDTILNQTLLIATKWKFILAECQIAMPHDFVDLLSASRHSSSEISSENSQFPVT